MNFLTSLYIYKLLFDVFLQVQNDLSYAVWVYANVCFPTQWAYSLIGGEKKSYRIDGLDLNLTFTCRIHANN